jgi:choline monooxygenase
MTIDNTQTFTVSPEQLEALSRPTLEAETLPAEVYWDPGIFESELKHVFFKEWLCVGRVEDVPNVGDYMTVNIASEPLIIIRDGQGEIRAHLNVCRHRSCQLMDGQGTVKAIRCPYHGWMYALNGELRGTPDFKETRNFDKGEYALHSAKVEIWRGYIMINMDQGAAPFRDQVTDADIWGLDRYRMGEMVTTHRWEYDIKCNWKVYVENFIEEYHIPWVHPTTFQPLTPMKRWAEYPDLTKQPHGIMIGQTPGLSFSNTGDALFEVSPGLDSLPPEYDGMPIWLAYPTLMVIPTVDALVYYVAFPDGPEQTKISLRLALHEDVIDAYDNGDPQVRAAGDEYAANAEIFLAEDNKISEQQQLGLRSRHGTVGRWSKHEGLARMFDKWVADKAYGPAADSSADGGT